MAQDTIEIKVNGQNDTAPQSVTLLSFIESKGLNPKGIVVELNGVIIRIESLSEHILNNSDEIEIIHFVGGG